MEYSRAYRNSKIAVQTLKHWKYYIQKRRESRKLKGETKFILFQNHIWHKVFKNGSSKICVRQLLKILKGYGLLRQTIPFQIF